MMELVLSLVLAHLVADFMLQTGKSCKDKKERHWKSPHHYGSGSSSAGDSRSGICMD